MCPHESSSSPIYIFYSYAKEDESLLNEIEKHISTLKQQGYISARNKRNISAGREWLYEINKNLNTADIILLIISADFLASDYCSSVEMQRALARHDANNAWVIPIIARPVDIQGTPFSELQALPSNGTPISNWAAPDDAFVDIVRGIRKVIDERIASCSYDSTVQVWNANDGGKVFIYREHSSNVSAVAWSPDGKRIASGSLDNTVQVWNANDGKNVFTYKGHSNGLTAVAWSPDGKRIASVGVGNTVQVWDASDGSNVFTYTGHSTWVHTVAWSPDGKYIASGSGDKTVRVWNASDGSNVFTYREHTNGVNSVAWSPDGQRIASGSADGTVRVWNVG